MSALDRKLFRDLWQFKGQAVAIALVIACGVASFIMFLSTLDSLRLSRDSFYRSYRFADLFAPLKSAPETVAPALRALPGVERVETRVVAQVSLDMPGFDEPVTGAITSIPDRGEPVLNRLYLKSGRLPELGRDNEVVVSEAFALAHGLHPGDPLVVIVKGRRIRLSIVGTGLSPESVHQLRPGGVFPDYRRYAVMWMAEKPLSRADQMEGAFNDVAMTLTPAADPESVIDRVDLLLSPYGGVGAFLRKDQLSNRFLSEEFEQLSQLSGIFPVIFMSVAAFLLNVVLSRLVATQRGQIAILKAFGYSNLAVGVHYVKLMLVIVGLAVIPGLLIGLYLGQNLALIYTRFFRLPYLTYRLESTVAAEAVLISVLSGFAGTLFAVWRSVRLSPAQAMRPEPPAFYRETVLEGLGPGRILPVTARMILRHLGMRPFKTLFSVLGIASAGAIMMSGRFQDDTVSFMLHVQFVLTQRQDLTVTFTDPLSPRAAAELRSLPGVMRSEPFRWVPVRLRAGHYQYRTGIIGSDSGGELNRVLDTSLSPVLIPREGLMLTDYLGTILHVKAGDRVTVEALEGRRTVREVPVSALVKQYLGLSGYMERGALNRLMGEGPEISGVYLSVDPAALGTVIRALKERPRISGVTERTREITNFNKTMEETMLFWTAVATTFATVIAFVVIYNAARITLIERYRELATLRVLGYTRGEISSILLGEIAVLTLVGLPLGFLGGVGLCTYIARALQSDLYRVPVVLTPSTYAYSALVVLLSTLFSGLTVRQKLDDLDLIGVLKTTE